MNKKIKTSKKTPLKSIRANCLECSNHQPSLVKDCHITECPLWHFRLGKNPHRIGIKKGFLPSIPNTNVPS